MEVLVSLEEGRFMCDSCLATAGVLLLLTSSPGGRSPKALSVKSNSPSEGFSCWTPSWTSYKHRSVTAGEMAAATAVIK